MPAWLRKRRLIAGILMACKKELGAYDAVVRVSSPVTFAPSPRDP